MLVAVQEEVDDDEGDMTMDVEPPKTFYDYMEEWKKFYAGNGQHPHNLVAEEKRDAVLKRTTEDDELLVAGEAAPRDLKKRRIQKTHAERDRIASMLAKKGVEYIGSETMLERMITFRDILLKPDAKSTLRGKLTREDDPFRQDPYDASRKTWRLRSELSRLNIPRVSYMTTASTGVTKADFDELYDETVYRSRTIESFNKPSIQRLTVSAENREKFKAILYGDTELLMKITPFLNSKGEMIDTFSIDQIYNEIKVAYFLNELLYGYTNVLSIHFMVMVDWLQASRSQLGIFEDPEYPTTMDTLTSQITITELAHTTTYDFFTLNPSFRTLKVVLFQLFHAIETAWHTNEFVHHDLHGNNVMFKRTDYEDSPFRGRSLLYKRRNVEAWYVLPKEDLGEHIVKIIDFGFSRIYAPKQPDHLLSSLSVNNPPHLHDRLIGLNWPENGIVPETPNRYTDVRLYLLGLYYLPKIFWDTLSVDERETLDALMEEVLDFKAMNESIDALPFRSEVSTIRRYNAGGVLTPQNIASCEPCLKHLTDFGGYARRLDPVPNPNKRGWTATDLLNHAFFDDLKRAPRENGTLEDQEKADQEELVVSFVDEETLTETQMLKVRPGNPFEFRGQQRLACAVCGSTANNIEDYNLEGEVMVPLCGALCAEFKYIYKGKTVFR